MVVFPVTDIHVAVGVIHGAATTDGAVDKVAVVHVAVAVVEAASAGHLVIGPLAYILLASSAT